MKIEYSLKNLKHAFPETSVCDVKDISTLSPLFDVICEKLLKFHVTKSPRCYGASSSNNMEIGQCLVVEGSHVYINYNLGGYKINGTRSKITVEGEGEKVKKVVEGIKRFVKRQQYNLSTLVLKAEYELRGINETLLTEEMQTFYDTHHRGLAYR